MSTTAASSNTNEPPSLFSSLPNDLVLNVLARVPRRYHPTLSCVSKSFRSLVNSSELRKTRSLLGKDDSFYVGFGDFYAPSRTYLWFTLSQNTDQNRLVSNPLPSPPQPGFSALMVGPEIYFIGGYNNHNSSYSKSMWILDSRSGKMRQGPSMLVARLSAAVGLVEEKIYAFGGYEYESEDEEIQAEVFDPKTQTWEVAPNPDVVLSHLCLTVVSPSPGRKIYATYIGSQVIVYDPRDGKCEKIDSPAGNYDKPDVCVIDDLVYIYKSKFGLMWYDSKEKEWRVVNGLKLSEDSVNIVEMAEYNGKLAIFRQCWGEKKNKEIWCAMISLGRSGVEIMGKVEWNDHVLSIPDGYQIMHCIQRTD